MPETMPENSTQVGDEAATKSDKQTTECKYGGNQHKYRAVGVLRRPQKRDASSNLSSCCNNHLLLVSGKTMALMIDFLSDSTMPRCMNSSCRYDLIVWGGGKR
jgi:hypothetical protein